MGIGAHVCDPRRRPTLHASHRVDRPERPPRGRVRDEGRPRAVLPVHCVAFAGPALVSGRIPAQARGPCSASPIAPWRSHGDRRARLRSPQAADTPRIASRRPSREAAPASLRRRGAGNEPACRSVASRSPALRSSRVASPRKRGAPAPPRRSPHSLRARGSTTRDCDAAGGRHSVHRIAPAFQGDRRLACGQALKRRRTEIRPTVSGRKKRGGVAAPSSILPRALAGAVLASITGTSSSRCRR